MNRKLYLKSALFRFLDKLPGALSYAIYHYIQGKMGQSNLPIKYEAAKNTFTDFRRMEKESGISIKEKTIMEIGSGWLPLMPYFLKYMGGAEEIFTFDLRQHYSPKAIKEFNDFFRKKNSVFTEPSENHYNLLPGIKYFPNTDLTKSDIPQVDLVFTRFVLEHVTPEDLKKIHLKLKEQLSPGSHIIHFISPSDHRAYVDKSLSLQDFLRFSEEEWRSKQTKFDYHNRWRLPQYQDLFSSLGFETIYLEYHAPDKNSEAYKKFKEVPVHYDFSKFTDEELTAGSINLVLKV